jgi:uncharacterized protein YggE
MKNLATFLALFLMCGAKASAQMVPMMPGSSGLASTVPGITVVGRGSASVPPDLARVTIRLMPQQLANTSATIEDTGRAVASALRASGVTDATYALPLEGNLGPTAQPAVTGSVVKPTRESVERIARATVKALPDNLPGIRTFAIGIAYFVTNCSAGEMRAQVAALADARARAEQAATAANVRVGQILALNESGSYLPPACSPASAASAQNAVFAQVPGQDPYGPLAVTITVNVTATFAIR